MFRLTFWRFHTCIVKDFHLTVIVMFEKTNWICKLWQHLKRSWIYVWALLLWIWGEGPTGGNKALSEEGGDGGQVVWGHLDSMQCSQVVEWNALKWHASSPHTVVSNHSLKLVHQVIVADCFVSHPRLQRWYVTIPSLDQWWTTIENHWNQWLPDPKTIEKSLNPMVAPNHSIQWWWCL